MGRRSRGESPARQIEDYQKIMGYLKTNPDIDFLVLDYSSHVEDAEMTMGSIAVFLGVGSAESPYVGKLADNRGDDQVVFEGEEWDRAVEMYEELRWQD